jgi:uncharacterized protein (TIGR00251 family)
MAPTSSWLSERSDGVHLTIKVTPQATRSAVRGIEVDAQGRSYLAVRVTEAPDAGKANAALIRLLAQRWRLAPSDLRLVRGANARRKVLHVRGPADQLAVKLEAIEGRSRASAGAAQ